jgi:hypothetical protein
MDRLEESSGTPVEEAFREGRRAGMAVGALAIGIVAFISLLGLEKAILALVLGGLVARDTGTGSAARKRAITAIVVASVYVIAFVVMMVLFHDKFAAFIRSLQQLG